MAMLPLSKRWFLFGGAVSSYADLTGPLVLPGIGVNNAAYVLTATDVLVYPTTAWTANHIWTLPSALTPASGKVPIVYFADPDQLVTATNTVTAAPNGSDQIMGANSNILALNAAGMSAMFVSDGVSKWTMGTTPGGAPVTYATAATVNPAYVALTDASPVVWATAGAPSLNASLLLTSAIGATRAISLTGIVSGFAGILWLIQPASGGPCALTLPGGSKVGNGGAGALTLSTAANAIDIVSVTYNGLTSTYAWTIVQTFT